MLGPVSPSEIPPKSYNVELLKRRFTNPSLADEYNRSHGIFVVGGGPDPIRVQIQEFRDDLDSKIHRLGSIRDRLPLIEEASGIVTQGASLSARGTKVFVVHGHDRGPRSEVARLLERLGLQVVILHEQPNLHVKWWHHLSCLREGR